MMFEARSCTALLRRAPTALALGPALLALAAAPNPATAQEWPPVNVYHSPGDEGADPRPECPPGCSCSGGTGETTLIHFNELDTYETVTDQYAPQATFSANQYHDVVTVWSTTSPSYPHAIQSCQDGTYCDYGEVYVTFSPTVENLSFWVGGDDSSETTLSVTAWNQSGIPMGTLNVPLDGLSNTWHLVDLSGFAGVWKIHIYYGYDYNGLYYDDFQWGAGAGTLDCVIKGTANEQLDLWIDGGSAGGDGDICKMGPEGDTGDYLCGADIRIEITRGTGVFTHILPVIPTLVHHPDCEPNGGNGFCSLPDNTKRIRMNFRRGPPPLVSAGPRKVASLLVNSTDSTEASPTTVVVNGIAAVSANLQLRPIAAGGAEVIAEGPIPAPEPGGTLMLATGLLGLAGLYRLRRRRTDISGVS